MPPAHQRLQADHRAALQAQARLVMQLQLVAAQGPAQLAFEIGPATRAAAVALVIDTEIAALGALGLLHGDMRMPHQQVGTDALTGLGHTQAAADQQALAIDPIRLGQGLGDLPDNPQRTPRITANIQQQGKLIAAQARQLITGLQLALEARHHLQDQMVTGLVTEGVIGVAKVVQVQVRHG